MITKEAWEFWLELPETKALQELARLRRGVIKDNWEEGAYLDSMMKNAEHVGACKALMMLEDLDYDLVILEELNLGERE